MSVIVIKRRFTARNEKELLEKGGELAAMHKKRMLGRSYYSIDKTGEKTGTKNQPYLSPLHLRKKI